MSQNYFTILFLIRKSKSLRMGETQIYMRIKVNGRRSEMKINRTINPDMWNPTKGCAVDRDSKSKEINMFLETMRSKVLRIHRELVQDESMKAG